MLPGQLHVHQSLWVGHMPVSPFQVSAIMFLQFYLSSISQNHWCISECLYFYVKTRSSFADNKCIKPNYEGIVDKGLCSQFCGNNILEQNDKGDTFKPSAKPGPRKDFDDVLLALSKLDLKISGSPSLEVKGKMSEKLKSVQYIFNIQTEDHKVH